MIRSWSTSDAEAEQILARAIRRTAELIQTSRLVQSNAYAERHRFRQRHPVTNERAEPAFESLNEAVYEHLPSDFP